MDLVLWGVRTSDTFAENESTELVSVFCFPSRTSGGCMGVGRSICRWKGPRE